MTLITTCIAAAAAGCDNFGLGAFFDFGGPTAETILTSSTLSPTAQTSRAASVTDSTAGLTITPDNVTGKALSVLFAIDQAEDEGVVVFGDERPDIASANSDLLAFDMAERLPIQSRVSLPPGYRGGPSSQMVILLGYMDFDFTLNGRARRMRVALADVDPMRRGDVLLEMTESTQAASVDPIDHAGATTDDGRFESGADGFGRDPRGADDGPAGTRGNAGPIEMGDFKWFDLSSRAFTSVRPDEPASIDAIASFTDPIRPSLVFYPINVRLSERVQLGASDLMNASSLEVVIDFVLSGSVVLRDQHDEGLDDQTLVTSFTLAQISTGFSDTGFEAAATVNFIGIEPNPSPGPVGGRNDDHDSPIGIEPNPSPVGDDRDDSPIGLAPLPSP